MDGPRELMRRLNPGPGVRMELPLELAHRPKAHTTELAAIAIVIRDAALQVSRS